MEYENNVLNMRQLWMSIFDEHLAKLNVTEKSNPLELLIEILYLQFGKNKTSLFQQCSCNVKSDFKEETINYSSYDCTPKKCHESPRNSLTENDLIPKKINIESEKSPIFVSKFNKSNAKKRRKSSKKLFLSKENMYLKNQILNKAKEDISVDFENSNKLINQNEILSNKNEFEIQKKNKSDVFENSNELINQTEIMDKKDESEIIESDNEFDTAIIGINNEVSLSEERCSTSKKYETESEELVNIDSVLEYLKDNKENNDESQLHKPKNSIQKEYAYKRDACRKKSERTKLQGWDCNACNEYYDCLGITDKRLLKERINKCSRHRSKYQEIYNTPKGFWDPEFSED